MGPRGSEIIALVASLHVVAGFAILFSEPAAWSTRTFDIWRMLPAGVAQQLVGLWGIIIGAAAMTGLARNGVGINPHGYRWFLPTVFTLFASAVLALTAVVEGRFGDGEPRPRMFIAVDQFVTIALPVFYSYALLNRYAVGWDHPIPWPWPRHRLDHSDATLEALLAGCPVVEGDK